jgi:streptogramin lyase
MGWPYNTVHSPIYLGAKQVTGIGTASATASSALPAATQLVKIVADGAIWYNAAGSASAAAGSYLPANTIEYVAVTGAAVISLMAVTTNGRSAWITPCAA